MLAALAPNQLFTFDLPPSALVDKVWVTNVSPDPPGVNDNAAISFLHAACSNEAAAATVPEPTSLLLFGTGAAALGWHLVRRQRTKEHD